MSSYCQSAAYRPALKLRRLAWFVTNESLSQGPGAAIFKRLLGSAVGRDHGVWSKEAPQFARNPDQGGEDRDEYQSANEVGERSDNGEHRGREERVGLSGGLDHERHDATNRGDER